MLLPPTAKHSAFTTRNSSLQPNGLYLRGNIKKNTANAYEDNRRKRLGQKRFSQLPTPTEKDLNRILFSRKVSEMNSSVDMNSMLAKT